MADTYPVDPRNRVRQLAGKAAYDRQTVFAVLDAALVAHVAVVQDGRPVVVPMIYGREGETLYLHGARKARIVRLLEARSAVSANVTLLDGIVFARSAFNSSMNYRSVTLFGTPELIDDSDEKLHAMRIISEHTMPGRWQELRAPSEREVRMTGVVRLVIESASAKIARGMPEDEDEDYALPVWAGVLPLETVTRALVDDGRLRDDAVPSAAALAMQNRKL